MEKSENNCIESTNWLFASFHKSIIQNIKNRILEITYVRIQVVYANIGGIVEYRVYMILKNPKSLIDIVNFFDDKKVCKAVIPNAFEFYFHYRKTKPINSEVIYEAGDELEYVIGDEVKDKKVKQKFRRMKPYSLRSKQIEKNKKYIDLIYQRSPRLYNRIIKLFPIYKIKRREVPLKTFYIHGEPGVGKNTFCDIVLSILGIDYHYLIEPRLSTKVPLNTKAIVFDEYDENSMDKSRFSILNENKIPFVYTAYNILVYNLDWIMILSNHDFENLFLKEIKAVRDSYKRRIDVYVELKKIDDKNNTVRIKIMNFRKWHPVKLVTVIEEPFRTKYSDMCNDFRKIGLKMLKEILHIIENESYYKTISHEFLAHYKERIKCFEKKNK